MEAVRAELGDTDGILEVTGRGDDWLDIVIWNPDGSQAELSGNGTRIAARWLTEQLARSSLRVGPREVVRGCSAASSSTGPGPARRRRARGVDWHPLHAGRLGNPHAVVEGDPADALRMARRSRR